MKTGVLCSLCILGTAAFCYMYFNGSNMLSKTIDPIEVFLNDPAAFRDFLRDDNTAEAIVASPTTRRVLTENADTADVLLSKNGSIDYVIEIKNQALANKAIAILRSNPAEFTKFFQDDRVANKIVQADSWVMLKVCLGFPDMEIELERLKNKTKAMERIQGIR